MPKKKRRFRRLRRFLAQLDPQLVGSVVLWGAVGLYVLACCLPMTLDQRPVRGGGRGVMLLLYGTWGLLASLFWPFLLAIKPNAADFRGWLELVRNEMPWLANPAFWWALWQFRQGRVRAAWMSSLVAAVLALSFLVMGLRTWIGVLAMPAYWCWLASMIWLAAWAGLADYQQTRSGGEA